jgi:6-phosphofructokinase 1
MRLGILTGGGDCPGLNAVIRAVTKHAILHHGWEVVGIRESYRGLVEKLVRPLGLDDVRGLLGRGGTILGSSNRSNPFAFPRGGAVADVSDEVIANIGALGLDAIVAVGGDGTMNMSLGLIQKGAKIVGVPKTIDNDLPTTDYTFGFATAVEVATQAVERLHTTAESHDRVMLCEVMGRYAGWIALHAGLAGGADVILIPEIPYDVARVREAIEARRRRGITFSVIVVAEGARPIGGQRVVQRPGDATQQEKLGGAADALARQLDPSYEVRVTVLGHTQRGGAPVAQDRILGTRFGAAAVDLVAGGRFGQMVTLRGDAIESVPIADACGRLKLVDPAGELARVARETGVELGG